MPSQFWVTGPVQLWAGLGSGTPGAAMFIGYCEKQPEISIKPYWTTVYCDFFGQQSPADLIYDGEDAIISADVTKFNEPAYSFMADRAVARAAGSAPGVNNPGEIGSLIVQEKIAFPLWMKFPYSAKPAMTGMPAGYRFVACTLEGPDGLTGLGTVNRKIRLVWHALRTLDNTVGQNVYGVGQLKLYDNSMTGLGVPD